MRTQVAIIGGGPAGSLLAFMLRRAGIDSVVLERRSKQYVLSRIRAGVIEQGSADLFTELGLGKRMSSEGFVHEGVAIAFAGNCQRIDFQALTGKHVTIYGQTELQYDLYQALEASGCMLVDEVQHVQVSDLDSGKSHVTYEKEGQTYRVDCDFVAACDGAHGIGRVSIPRDKCAVFERTYPFAWLGLLSHTPPVSDELIYAHHERGFALCSMRNEGLSRYYVQCPADDDVQAWSDDRFWNELCSRLPTEIAARLVTGPSIEKSVTPLRSFVLEPMRYGRMFLAGDSAHIVPPTGAKGLNLAVSDVVYLHEALVDHYATGAMSGLDAYSDRALSRVWKAVRFSWWMTNTLHRFPSDSPECAFNQRLQVAELSYLLDSEVAQLSFAENYVGLPY